MNDTIKRQKKILDNLRKRNTELYKTRFLEEDGLYNALNHNYDEIDHHLIILQALVFSQKHDLCPVKGKRIFRKRLRCDPSGCSKCTHKSCKV